MSDTEHTFNPVEENVFFKKLLLFLLLMFMYLAAAGGQTRQKEDNTVSYPWSRGGIYKCTEGGPKAGSL